MRTKLTAIVTALLLAPVAAFAADGIEAEYVVTLVKPVGTCGNEIRHESTGRIVQTGTS